MPDALRILLVEDDEDDFVLTQSTKITSATFSTCTALSLSFTVKTNASTTTPWKLNGSTFSSGVTHGSITGIRANLSGSGCSATVMLSGCVVLSNCVINLSPEKQRVFDEAFRVLKSGGQLAVADMVATAPLPDEIKSDWAAYTGCIAGASQITDLQRMLEASGFQNIKIAPKDSSRSFIREWLPGKRVEDYLISATIEAVKPTPALS